MSEASKIEQPLDLGDEGTSEDTAKAVQVLLETMQTRFQQLSEKIINRIDTMGNRIDDLEKSINLLMRESENKGLNVPQTSVSVSPSGKLVSAARSPLRG